MSVSDSLKQALDSCGETRAHVSRETGIPESVLSRFVRGESTLRGYHVDTLAEYLGWELVKRAARQSRKKGAG